MGEVLVILLIALLVFGTKKLKGVGSDLGAAVYNFKRAMNGDNTPKAVPVPARKDAEFQEGPSASGEPGA